MKRIPWNKGKIGTQTAWNKGMKGWRKHSKKWKKAHSLRMKRQWKSGVRQFNTQPVYGKKHWNWKGSKVGYGALHDWVRARLGTPEKCADCGKDGLKGRLIHWANISGKYRRVLRDWKRLCTPCHKKFDLKRLKSANV